METALVYVHLSQKRWFSKSLQLILFFIYDSILFPVLTLRLNGTFTATNSGVYFGSWIFCLLSFISLFPLCLYTVYIFFCPHRWVFKCFGRVGLSELRLCKAPFSLNLCLLSSLSASISFGVEKMMDVWLYRCERLIFTIRHRKSPDFCTSGLYQTTINLRTDENK